MDNSKKDFLLEIGTEEIPASLVRMGSNSLKELIVTLFDEKSLSYDLIQVYFTPRRITLYVKLLESKQADHENEIIGPRVENAFDKDGHPTKAGEGFARARNVSLSKLIKKETPKGLCVAVRIKTEGKYTKEILEESVPSMLAKMTFKKKMQWADIEDNFVRPIHWIAALFGDEVLNFKFAKVQSDCLSRGHRFLSPASFRVENFEQYMENLKKRYVVIDHKERKNIIEDGLQIIEKQTKGKVIKDNELLDEVANLVEFPVVEIGSFDSKFLELPKEVIITALRTHQKYFALEQKDRTGLLPQFAMVHNNVPSEMTVVNRGNERVLSARLTDAMFFFEEDKKKKLDHMVVSLQGRAFVKGLGTTYDKTLRIQEFVKLLSQNILTEDNESLCRIVSRSAYLCKADLISQMVFEFPELQGVMGMHYARAANQGEDVAMAIFEHYLPRFANDKIPQSEAGILLSLADKIDSLTGCFGLGIIPSGSEDPFALRRQAMGILHIMMEKPVLIKQDSIKVRLTLSELINLSLKRYFTLYPSVFNKCDKIEHDLKEFFKGRLSSLLTAQKIMNEFAEAAICADSGFDDPFDTYHRARAIQNFYDEHKEHFEPLIITFKRVGNILKNQNVSNEIREDLLIEEPEKKLYNEFIKVSHEVEIARKKEYYHEILLKMLNLKPYVDIYFDNVMVMVEDSCIRNNRLNMLYNIRKTFYNFADFSKISTR